MAWPMRVAMDTGQIIVHAASATEGLPWLLGCKRSGAWPCPLISRPRLPNTTWTIPCIEGNHYHHARSTASVHQLQGSESPTGHRSSAAGLTERSLRISRFFDATLVALIFVLALVLYRDALTWAIGRPWITNEFEQLLGCPHLGFEAGCPAPRRRRGDEAVSSKGKNMC